jgi:hypothetical protein
LLNVKDALHDARAALQMAAARQRPLAKVPVQNPPSVLLGPSGPEDLNNLKAHTDRTSRLLFPPPGGTLVTAGNDGKLKLWEVPALRLKAEADTLPGRVGARARNGSFARATPARWRVSRSHPAAAVLCRVARTKR